MTKNFDIDIPFVDFIGIYLIEKKNGYSKLGINLKEEYKNSWGAVHGGVLCSLLDVTLATSARSLDINCIGAITIEFKIYLDEMNKPTKIELSENNSDLNYTEKKLSKLAFNALENSKFISTSKLNETSIYFKKIKFPENFCT